MNKIIGKINKFIKNFRITVLAVLLCLFFCFIINIHPVQAQEITATIGGWVVQVLSWIIYVLDYALGYILTLVIDVLVDVVQFNNIISVRAVEIGWVVVRDLCNMFFVLIILIIAFATILRYENYHVKRLLPKLLIMAVLINFSKTICGLIIDFAQVIMLTFVNGFAATGAGNFVQMFNVQEYLSVNDIQDEALDNWDTALGLIAGSIALLITLIVCVILLLVLVFRIVMLWIYVILSPLAFLLSAFPAGMKYASQWWSQFSKQVITGPILVFFIWLALLTAQQSANDIGLSIETKTISTGHTVTCAGSNIFCGPQFQVYLITIALLVGGLIVTQQLGGVAGSAAGRGMGWIRKGAYAGLAGIGAGVGYRWAKDRAGAFMGARQAARKERAEATGRRIYGLYEGGKGVVKGAARGLYRATAREGLRRAAAVPAALPSKINEVFARREERNRRRFSASRKDEGEIKTKNNINYSWNKDLGRYMKEGFKEQTKTWEDNELKFKIEQNTLKDEEGKIEDRYGRYKDAKGNEYRYDEKKDNYYRVNRDGLAVDKNGDPVEEKNREWAGITRMGARRQRFQQGWDIGRSKAYALKNQANDEAIEKSQKAMSASGLTLTNLNEMIDDKTVDRNQRIAAALTLAIKEGFKDRGKVERVKELIGPNNVLMNRFNDTIDKKFAHLNYDLATDSGRERFKERLDEGKIEGTKLDPGAYKEVNTLKTMQDYYGLQFAGKMEEVGKNSRKHADSLKEGLTQAVKNVAEGKEVFEGRPVELFDDEKQEVNRFSKALAGVTGDLVAASGGSGGAGKFNVNVIKKMVSEAKSEQLAKIDVDSFDEKKVEQKFSLAPGDAQKIVQQLKNSIKESLSVAQLDGLRKSGKASNKLVETLATTIASDKNKKRQIEENYKELAEIANIERGEESEREQESGPGEGQGARAGFI